MALKKNSNPGATEKSGAASGPIDAPDRRRLPPLLRRAWYGLNQTFRRRIAHTGATPDQFTALRSLLEGHGDGITQRQLTEAMSSDPNTIASLLERMEKAGWVERREHESDKRAYRIRLKPAGKRKYEELRALAIELQSVVLASLPENRREQFLEDLAAVADGCRDAAENSSGKFR
ncbi:MAG: MarR family transcriptional regulator [Verrucomicrobia bacterium]|nr:MarR family transcriptional regulator [Verrucomicrobiota bacterium]